MFTASKALDLMLPAWKRALPPTVSTADLDRFVDDRRTEIAIVIAEWLASLQEPDFPIEMFATISKSASRTLDLLVKGLDVYHARRIDNSSAFMAVSVERLSVSVFSVAHYYEENRDLIADPDVELYRLRPPDAKRPGVWTVMSITHPRLPTRRYLSLDGEQPVPNRRRRGVSDATSFISTWMRNIIAQQGGRAAVRKAVEETTTT